MGKLFILIAEICACSASKFSSFMTSHWANELPHMSYDITNSISIPETPIKNYNSPIRSC